MKTFIKSANNIFLGIFVLVTFSCNDKKDNILYLENNHNKFLKIYYKNDIIEINENNSYRPIKIFKRYKEEYYLGNKEKKSLVFLSNKKNYKYNLYDEFSLLDDSIFIKNIDDNNYLTSVKSNKKPVMVKYFYNKEYKIYKIIYKIGEESLIYK